MGRDEEKTFAGWNIDFNVWSARKRTEKLEYMRRNPLTRKLVGHPKDWLWSSWSIDEKGKDGLVPIDPVGREHSEVNEFRREKVPARKCGVRGTPTHLVIWRRGHPSHDSNPSPRVRMEMPGRSEQESRDLRVWRRHI